MPLELLDHCSFLGPALPEPFVRFELEKELSRSNLLPRTTSADGKQLQASWESFRRKLRELAVRGGPLRVRHCVLDPLVERLGFERSEPAPEVETREGREDGGFLLTTASGAKLRTWATEFEEDLDAPARRGAAYRFSHLRIAQRVLLASNERVGLLTNGVQLRVLISDPARPDSEVVIPLESSWKRSREVPDSFRLVLALCQPAGIKAIPELVEKARLQQARVTKDLRLQARDAVERFVQEVLDHPGNAAELANHSDRTKLARELWHEGLVMVYRLLFILKLESTDDPARSFSFTSSSLWRNTFSPGVALAARVRDVLDQGLETGHYLEEALRNLFRMFVEGLECSELHIKPLGGALFGPEAAPLMDRKFHWGERAVAYLLDRLLWTQQKRGVLTRQRVHYGALDVEDLGRVYEALLELDAGISTERLCRLRRQKLEVVVPVAQGEKYRPATVAPQIDEPEEDVEDAEGDETEEESSKSAKKTKIEWIEEIPPNRFFLRVGLGRKATGSYYTPHSFVRFLVQETLGPLCADRSPQNDPNPMAILRLKVLDPAMGSGHFLVEACRFLAEKLYEACRLCDELADPAERRAELAIDERVKSEASAEAAKWRRRVLELPDPNDEILQYLPSRAPEGAESGVSQRRALALCRRLVSVHCLYGVDKNRLAVELSKLSLWIESHGEGLPLTFLDHRLVEGDSLTGPFFDYLLTYPHTGEPLEGLFAADLKNNLRLALGYALKHVSDLESSVGATLSETEFKKAAKTRLDQALAPLRQIAALWSGYLMSAQGTGADYAQAIPLYLAGQELRHPAANALPFPFDLAFPEVFFPTGDLEEKRGFDVILGNPPWDRMLPSDKEFFASYNFDVMSAPTKRERTKLQKDLEQHPDVAEAYSRYISEFRGAENVLDRVFGYQTAEINGERTIGKQDAYRAFMERSAQLLHSDGIVGLVVPSAFHANEGATGIRRLYLEQMDLRCCFSFENRKKLFEIHSSFKFATLVAAKRGPTRSFRCAFYLDDDEWLFRDRREGEQEYTLEFVRRTGGEYLSLLEIRTAKDLAAAQVCFGNGVSFGELASQLSIHLGREANMTDDAWRFTPTDQLLMDGEDPRDPTTARSLLSHGYLVLHEGKTLHQFTDRWEDRPRYIVALEAIRDKPEWLHAARFYRLAYRSIASSTNERTAILSFLPPCVFGNSAPCDRKPESRSNASALLLAALANTYSADWTLRLKAGANVNLFLMNAVRLAQVDEVRAFFVHAALRLVCNHSGYAQLWAEQMGGAWRETAAEGHWPVLDSEQKRWELRAAVDALAAFKLGLDRNQYAHVLSTFNHKSFPSAPLLCLGHFDAIESLGPAGFAKSFDPYADIEVYNAPPKPLITLPIEADSPISEAGFSLTASPMSSRGRRRR